MVGEFVLTLPNFVLHDHLDGGLRPSTIIELAFEQGYGDLPTKNLDELTEWFDQGSQGQSLEAYLQSFVHTVALMQREDAIRRVTREWVEDMAAEGVVYGEVRVAPELLTQGGLSLTQVVDVIGNELELAGQFCGVVSRLICCAMRTGENSLAVARVVADRVGSNVVAFDLAGSERAGPALKHKEAIDLVHSAGGLITLHAGEGDGVESIRQAAIDCRAHRIGHGVRILEDIDFSNHVARFGEVAQFILDHQIHLEICPTSNIHTGLYKSLYEHPITTLVGLGFSISVNPDNRLMSRTSVSQEFAHLMETHGWTDAMVSKATDSARLAAFNF